MKIFTELVQEQEDEVRHYKKIASDFVDNEIISIPQISGVLLAGSTDRGDARKGSFGFSIDIVLVLEKNKSIDLVELFGESVEPPEIPFHCIKRQNELFTDISNPI